MRIESDVVFLAMRDMGRVSSLLGPLVTTTLIASGSHIK
jgi:hypothetical protein